MSSLFLIPTPIGESGMDEISTKVLHSVADLRYFVVENLKTARRVLRKMGFKADFDSEVQFFEWDKHSENHNYELVKSWLESKKTIGLMSEAGLPCIADPGNDIVTLAHKYDYNVVPLAGPSSIILALIAGGMNGQNFAFNGYLPIDKAERVKKIKQLEARALSEKQTQLFMETPYRNLGLVEDVIKNCSQNISFSIASNIGESDAYIKTKSIQDWKKIPLPDIHKKPTIFSLGLS